MPTLDLSVAISNAQDFVLGKIATQTGATKAAILTAAAQEHAKSLHAQFERDLLLQVPDIWTKATDAEKAALVAKFEELRAR